MTIWQHDIYLSFINLLLQLESLLIYCLIYFHNILLHWLKITLRLQAEIIPLCEVKLIKKLTELLSSVEPVETTLKDAMRKAKAKLQREWSNFKEGYV